MIGIYNSKIRGLQDLKTHGIGRGGDVYSVARSRGLKIGIA